MSQPGEPLDKAGAYGIQGAGRLLVERIDGDYPTSWDLPSHGSCASSLASRAARRTMLPRPSGSEDPLPSEKNLESITQIPGIYAAHATNETAGTGCTVICCPAGATGGVDVRGGAPATRETDLLRPEETVDVLHAVVLSGGSAWGLPRPAASPRSSERRGFGLDVSGARVPIVSGACLFDLACGRPTGAPRRTPRRLRRARQRGRPPRGNVGAGTGCTVGKLGRPERAMKSGLGEDVSRRASSYAAPSPP